MYNVKASGVLLSVNDGANPAHVTSTGDHDEVASIKLDKVDNLVLLQVESDSVVDPDGRIRITNCSAIVCDDVGDTTGTESGLANLEELVSSFFRLDSVDRETALDVVQETVVFARFFNRNNIHESSGVGLVSANLIVDFDETLLDNRGDFSSSESVF